MGNDDKVEPEAIRHITQCIEEYEHPTVLNLNGYLYDRHLQTRLHPQVRVGLRKGRFRQDTLFGDISTIVESFGDSFGFLGDNVFRRALWNEIVSNSDLKPYYTSCYIHLVVLLRMLQRSPRLLYVHRQCVGYRGNNDLFLEMLGEVRRLRMDVVGYHQVADGVFSKGSTIYRSWMSRVMRFHIRSRLLGVKLGGNSAHMRQVARVMFDYYKHLPAFWLHIFPVLFMPRSLLLGLRLCYRSTIKRAMQHLQK
jgi:hypothetical protein